MAISCNLQLKLPTRPILKTNYEILISYSCNTISLRLSIEIRIDTESLIWNCILNMNYYNKDMPSGRNRSGASILACPCILIYSVKICTDTMQSNDFHFNEIHTQTISYCAAADLMCVAASASARRRTNNLNEFVSSFRHQPYVQCSNIQIRCIFDGLTCALPNRPCIFSCNRNRFVFFFFCLIR